MSDSALHKNDPSDQLAYLNTIGTETKSKFKQLSTATSIFINSFESQASYFRKVYKRTAQEQATYNNLFTVKKHLEEVVRNLQTFERLSSFINSEVTNDNFNRYIDAMHEIHNSERELKGYEFDDARQQLVDLQRYPN